jgi:rhamnogalacturonyl hydrolase YesR
LSVSISTSILPELAARKQLGRQIKPATNSPFPVFKVGLVFNANRSPPRLPVPCAFLYVVFCLFPPEKGRNAHIPPKLRYDSALVSNKKQIGPAMKASVRQSWITAALLLFAPLSHAQRSEFTNWPAGTSPREIGKRVADHFVATPHTNFGRPEPPTHITYPESVTWYGALSFAQLSGDKDLAAQLVARFAPLFNQESALVPPADHVDNTVFAIVPLEIYIQTNDPRFRELGLQLADKQWESPTPEGLTSQTRFWIDDMYMVTAVQVQAYRATRDAKYLDRAAQEMAAYLEKLQQPNGLFYHAPDVPFFWGRGDGWVAAGMTELLRSLPANDPRRARIMDSYRKMMATLLKYQAKDGMWRQLIDHPESWEESSCTAMFTFAMITGAKNGWLKDKAYAKAARKGWLALVANLEPNGDLKKTCEGTGKKNDLQYYLTRARSAGDLHGQAPVLWCASALLRKP